MPQPQRDPPTVAFVAEVIAPIETALIAMDEADLAFTQLLERLAKKVGDPFSNAVTERMAQRAKAWDQIQELKWARFGRPAPKKRSRPSRP